MDDPLLVGFLNGPGNLPGDLNRIARLHGAPGDAVSQRLALDQFQHQEEDAGVLLQAVNGGDVRVIQRSQQMTFALEASHALGVGGDLGPEDLDRDLAVQARVVGPIDHAHPALADLLDDPVMAEGFSYHRHVARKVTLSRRAWRGDGPLDYSVICRELRS